MFLPSFLPPFKNPLRERNFLPNARRKWKFSQWSQIHSLFFGTCHVHQRLLYCLPHTLNSVLIPKICPIPPCFCTTAPTVSSSGNLYSSLTSHASPRAHLKLWGLSWYSQLDVHTPSSSLKVLLYISPFAFIHSPLPWSHFYSCLIPTTSVLIPFKEGLISASPATFPVYILNSAKILDV